MAIGDQFSGLNMKNLIGGPLSAAAESSVTLAQSTANFIMTVGLDEEKKTRNVAFKYHKFKPNDDGSMENQEVLVEVPLLAIVPIPNLQIDSVNILFDMEVKQCEKSESSLDAGGSFNAKVGWGPISVSISGSVSSHTSNTRSSDNSAKYHVDVTATNHGMPEGLSRVLDMMAANISPLLVGSKAVDAGGQALTGKSKEKNDALKALRAKQMAAETAMTSSGNILDNRLRNLNDACKSYKDSDNLKIHQALNTIDLNAGTEEEKKTSAKKQEKLEQALNNINNKWMELNNRARSIVEIYASRESDGGKKNSVVDVIALVKFVESDGSTIVIKSDEIAAINECFEAAIKTCKEWQQKNKEVENIKADYNAKMME